MSAQNLLRFLDRSPTPFHAIKETIKRLENFNFQRLDESSSSSWNIKAGGNYYFTRNNSSIVAFSVGDQFGNKNDATGCLKIIAAHSDSPCLKIRPLSKIENEYSQVGIETYGGGLWHTWFDRDLGIAGRIILASSSSSKSFSNEREVLVRIDSPPPLRIPNLAIHLDRSTDGFLPNKEIHLQPIMSSSSSSMDQSSTMMNCTLRKKLLELSLATEDEDIVSHELSLFDVQPASFGGINGEYVLSARLDNLFMSYCAIESLLEGGISPSLSSHSNINIAILYDHEECGSDSIAGAGSTLLNCAIDSIFEGHSEMLKRSYLTKGLLISADMAHAVHPNYPEKHERLHRPLMQGGIVIKHNSNQRYATNSRSASYIKCLAKRSGIPVQEFMVRNDSPCGSTVGPIISTKLGIPTIDVGAPQLSMHSIREMAGRDDVDYSIRLFKEFFSSIENTTIVDRLL